MNEDNQPKMPGPQVSLPEMLDAREARSRLQSRLLKLHKEPLICLTLNIPGPVKLLPGVPEVFDMACSRIEGQFEGRLIPVSLLKDVRENTGCEAFYHAGTDPETAKKLMIGLEDQDRLGRLLDIDVLRADGTKVSRQDLGFPARRCLLCGEPAQVCSRSRKHSVEELTGEISRIIGEALARRLGSPLVSRFAELCSRSLLAEVSATPKPGLVDRHDSGAHTDMNYSTFVASTEAIVPYLAKMFEMGLTWPHDDGIGLFAAIRPVGIEAEKAMFAATEGINTHKGMIFSMGTVAAAAGLSYRLHGCFQGEVILELAGELCHGQIKKDFRSIDRKNPKTHGELLYLRYGIKGIRGEAQKGFPSIREISLPAIRAAFAAGEEENAAYLDTLLALIAKVDDTNVLIRTNHNMLSFAKSEAARLVKLGGASAPHGIEALKRLNKVFTHLNISPGGCADLLAVTILLWHLEQEEARGTGGARSHGTPPQSPRP